MGHSCVEAEVLAPAQERTDMAVRVLTRVAQYPVLCKCPTWIIFLGSYQLYKVNILVSL